MVEQHLSGNVNLTLGSEDSDDVTRRFLVGEANGRVGLGLDVVDEDALLAEEGAMVPPRNRDGLDDKVLVLGADELHDRLLKVLEVDGVLGGSARDDVVLVVRVSTESGEFFGVGELDVDAELSHDPLNVLASNADDTLVVRLGDVERDLGGQLLLKHCEAV